MPIYPFNCPCGKEFEEFHYMKDKPDSAISSCCGLESPIGISKRQYVSCFKPVVTDNITGKPIEITSVRQLDNLCKEHNLTCDSNKYHRKPKFRSAAEDLDYGSVKRAIQRGKLEDGSPVELPETSSK